MTTRRKSPKKPESFAGGVGRGLRRAARTAREVARMEAIGRGKAVLRWLERMRGKKLLQLVRE